jgi:hypothetical protein
MENPLATAAWMAYHFRVGEKEMEMIGFDVILYWAMCASAGDGFFSDGWLPFVRKRARQLSDGELDLVSGGVYGLFAEPEKAERASKALLGDAAGILAIVIGEKGRRGIKPQIGEERMLEKFKTFLPNGFSAETDPIGEKANPIAEDLTPDECDFLLLSALKGDVASAKVGSHVDGWYEGETLADLLVASNAELMTRDGMKEALKLIASDEKPYFQDRETRTLAAIRIEELLGDGTKAEGLDDDRKALKSEYHGLWASGERIGRTLEDAWYALIAKRWLRMDSWDEDKWIDSRFSSKLEGYAMRFAQRESERKKKSAS